MKNFRFKDQTPTNYPLWDINFIPYLEFNEKKISISKLHIARTSIKEQDKLHAPNIIFLPYSLTKQELGKLIQATSAVIDSYNPETTSKNELVISVRKAYEDSVIGQFCEEKPKEKTICSLSMLPEYILDKFLIDSYDNPLLKDCNDYKDLPGLVDAALQEEYKKGNQIMLTAYDNHEIFAEEFLFTFVKNWLNNEELAQKYVQSSSNEILNNVTPRNNVEKLIIEKVNILKESLQDFEFSQYISHKMR